MRKLVLVLLATALASASIAQTPKSTKKAKKEPAKRVGSWKQGGVFALNVNQGGFDNWLPAGDADMSFGLNGFVKLYADKAWAGKKKGKAKNWNNNLDIVQAIQNIHDERTDINQFNKLDDRVELLSRYSIAWKNKFNWAFIGNVRTQLYDTRITSYNGNNEVVSRKRVNGFFAPAVITFSPGIEYKPTSWFSAYVSPLSSRWIVLSNAPYSIVNGTGQAKPFGVDPQRKVDWQPGGFAQLQLNKELNKAKTISLTSRLDLYSNYANNPQNVDVFFTNLLNMKVSKWISASIGLTMIYDDDIRQFGFERNRAGLQYNHNLNIGLTKKF